MTHSPLLATWPRATPLVRLETPGTDVLTRPMRMSLEAPALGGLPLVPLGDGVGARAIETPLEEQRAYPAIGWQIIAPKWQRLDGKSPLPSSAILDVYVGLLYLYHQAGSPADGVVRFSRYEFLRLLGWLTTKRGSAVRKPSGRHYQQLAQAVNYLQRTSFVASGPQLQVGLDGALFRGAQGFTLIQYWRLADEEGPVPSHSMVVFSQPLQRALQAREPMMLDLDMYLGLPTGTPRQLYRLITWMRATGQTELPLRELFSRLGSVQEHAVPARARQILTVAHRLLRARGVIRGEPTFVRDVEHGWSLRYVLEEPAHDAADLVEVLASAATRLGVRPAMAHHLAATRTERLAAVVAALLQGHLLPKQNLPGLVVRATQGEEALPGEPHPQATVSRAIGAVYLRELAEARQHELATWCQRGVTAEQTHLRLLGSRALPAWVIQGVWAAWVDALRDAPTYAGTTGQGGERMLLPVPTPE